MLEEEMHVSVAVTEGIRVVVRARYSDLDSFPAAGRYAFIYTVRIRNDGPQAAQLRARHWVIADASGNVTEVRGPGVVGEKPLLRPGEHFEYTSGAVLKTPRGKMHGSYRMHRPNGRAFDAVIAPFLLAQPYSLN